MKLTLHYSVENGCTDGVSAYPIFYELESLAEWHQDNMSEGWGEPCTGSITVTGDNLKCTEVQSKESCYFDILLEHEDEEQAAKFRAKFFPKGFPEFTVKISQTNYYGVYVKGKLVHEKFAYPEKKANEKGVKKLQNKLESLIAGK